MTAYRSKLLKGSAVLAAGEIAIQTCGLARNLIVARMISPDQFGIAAALAMSVSLVEMISELGAGRFLTRVLPGDTDDLWLAVAHGITLARGLCTSLLLFALAGPIANLMNMPQEAWAFRVVALVPLIRALTHHDIWLVQRDLHYRASVACQAAPQVLMLLLAYPLARLMPDFRALLILLMANAGLSTFISHVVATRIYRIAYDRDKVKELLTFGMPLLLDGVFMFVVLHGERIVIGSTYGQLALGIYSAAFMLAWTPAAILGRFAFSLGVPHLARLRKQPTQRDTQYFLGLAILTCPAAGVAVLFAMGGDAVLKVVFGTQYDAAYAMVAWLGLGHAFRILRAFPAVVAISEAYTSTAMVGNLIRAGSVAVAWIVAARGAHSPTVLMVGVFGEVAAMILIVFLNSRKLGIAALPHLPAVATVLAAAGGASWIGTSHWFIEQAAIVRATCAILVGGATSLVASIAIPTTRRLYFTLIREHILPQERWPSTRDPLE